MDPCCELPETWKPVVGWEGLYEVSDHGRVWSVRRGLMKGTLTPSDGYVRLEFSRDGYRRKVFAHILVLTAFDKPCPDGLECCHWDDNPANNHLTNLRWDTQSANMFDQVRNGTHYEAARTHCPAGHPYAGMNLYVAPSGERQCGVRVGRMHELGTRRVRTRARIMSALFGCEWESPAASYGNKPHRRPGSWVPGG